MRKQLLKVLTAVILFLIPNVHFGQAPTLGTTTSFALFTATGALDNVGASFITGDIGSFDVTQTGFPGTGTVIGTIFNVGDPLLTSAAADVATAYTSFPAGGTVISTPLETQILTAGVYQTVGAAILNGELTLDGGGDENALFIIKIVGGALTVGASSASNIKLINSASACNVYWQVGGAFSLSGGSTFNGTAIVDGAINISASTMNGRALSTGGLISTSSITSAIAICNIVGTPVFTLGTASSRNQGAGSVTYTATATNSTSITYSLDAASITAGNSIVEATGVVTYVAGWSGTSIITITATGVNGPTTAIHMVTINPSVATPVFTLGATTTRNQGAGSVTYTATATNSTSISYSLDAASITAGNTIVEATGVVTYVAGWSGTSIITITATGANGPTTAIHTVTISPSVGTTVFTLGATSIRCIAAGTATYTATASNTTGITYSLDATSITAGNSIVESTGVVTYVAGWSGTSIITASAAGLNGPTTATHSVTISPAAGTPVFTLGATSNHCQVAGSVTYTATATNTSGITYALDATSITAGNTIVAATGVVTYVAGWSGTSIITASAAGCGGSSTASHTATTTLAVSMPIFTLGATSTRCQIAGSVTYTATATNTNGITYSLDATSITAGNSIVEATGVVIYVAGWSGTSIITASAAGCSGSINAIHTATTALAVSTPIFTLGATSTRCQAVGSVTYMATATNTSGIIYTLDEASVTGGNSIATANGIVTYVAGWNGTSIITASAAGCSGSKTAIHTVTINIQPLATTGSNSGICKDNSVIIGAHSIAGHTYLWSPALGLNSITIANPVANPSVTTTYTLTETITATGCQKTDSVNVTANTAPYISTAPNNQLAKIDGSISFSVVATGSFLTYQWRRGNVNLVNGGNISGATSAILTINPVLISDTASNYNVVIGGACAPIITSANATLWICECICDASIKSEQTSNVVTIYPNPFSMSTTIMIIDASDFNNYDLRIYNTSGIEVMNTILNRQSTTIDMSSLPSGVYFYKAVGNDNIIQQGKMIFQ